MKQQANPDMPQNASSPNFAKQILADPSEQITAIIGNNYLQSILTGAGMKKGYGILTDRRFYYKGKNFGTNGSKSLLAVLKSLSSSTQEGAVSVEDISYTGFTYIRPTGIFIFAIASLVWGILGLLSWRFGGAVTSEYFYSEVLVPFSGIGMFLLPMSALCFIIYFLKRRSIFEVYFPGGSFGYDMRWYPISEFQDFQRQISLIKDHAKRS